jgi:type II secretory pathway component PulC
MFKGLMAIVLMLGSVSVSALAESAYQDSVTVDGDTVSVSQAAFDHIHGQGLLTILNQAAATPVVDNDGDTVGFMLSDIDAGSVFLTVGLQDFDVVTEIDGMRLSDPRRAVEILRYARTLDAFDVKIQRLGVPRTIHVKVGGAN